MKDKLILQVDVDDLDETTGIELISVVSKPAMEAAFIRLSEDIIDIQLSKNEEKQILTGVVITPNKEILRLDDSGDPYYIKFSEEAVERIRNRFFLNGNLKISNVEHNDNDKIEAIVVESWLVDNPSMDKSLHLGLEGVEKGSLVVSYHVPNKAVWDSIKDMNGFSLQGNFKTTKAKLSSVEDDLLDEILKLLDE